MALRMQEKWTSTTGSGSPLDTNASGARTNPSNILPMALDPHIKLITNVLLNELTTCTSYATTKAQVIAKKTKHVIFLKNEEKK